MFNQYKPWWICILILIIFDTLMVIINHKKLLTCYHQKDSATAAYIRQLELKQAIAQTIFWIFSAFVFAFFIAYKLGGDNAITFINGYCIEKMLSIDNIFIFYVIFNRFNIFHIHIPFLLMVGILGAIIFRGIFIWLGITLLKKYAILHIFLGIVLLVSGFWLAAKIYKDFFQKSGAKSQNHEDTNLWILSFFSKFFHNFFSAKSSLKKRALAGLIAILLCDITFSIDSIPCILAITNDPFLIYTSNIFAILGMRSLFIVVSAGIDRVPQLQLGLSFVLCLIGTKLALGWVVPSYLWLVIIIGSFLLGIIFYPKRKVHGS